MNQMMLIPSDLFKKIQKLSAELGSVKREIKKAIKVPKSQAWFWSKAWQMKERSADKAIKEGKVKTFPSVEELLKDLHK